MKATKIGIVLMPMLRHWEDASMLAMVMQAVKPNVSTASRTDSWIVRVRCFIFLIEHIVGVLLKYSF